VWPSRVRLLAVKGLRERPEVLEPIRHTPVFSKKGCGPIKPFSGSQRDRAKMLDRDP
jgi:hypothetical protein